MKKIILLLLVLILSNNSTMAQITHLIIGVDGFTCSLCAKGVEEQFKSLDFVKSVKTDLKNTTFNLSFKNSPKINILEIKEAVEDGGFSLRDIKLEAEGTVKGSSSEGYFLSTPNSPDMRLIDLKEDLSAGDRVKIKGNVILTSSSVSVTSITKI
ncbi:MAG TPA: heavy-metal-associated domain-containing protein [Ignavibacteria bacterium]|nr:heavy-metal-associated domain-containing protein [Ignavibacteria bacterium]HMR41512.1 heavy-metal-associated domain-containing protein [Ignavibacteria bacterium]